MHSYLQLISEAIRNDSTNNGSLRKNIWAYLYSKYNDTVDYRDFLIILKRLMKVGKVDKTENGYYRIDKAVYREIWKDKEEFATPVAPSNQTKSK